VTGREYNPNSVDAQLATVLTRMNGQDVYLRAIHTQTTLTNGRVTKLEFKIEGRWKYLVGIGAGAAAVATFFWKLLEHFAK
jgi:hypothetical protein